MKKHVATFCALLLVLIAGLTNLVGCSFGAVVNGLTPVGGYENAYFVGDAPDLGEVQLLVSYDDGTSVTKTAKELGATVSSVDMSTAGVKSVQITFEGFTANITFNVIEKGSEVETFDGEIESFSIPEFYANYLTVSSTVGNTDADFKVANRIYEVGTDNKFLFRPVITGFDANDEIFSSKSHVRTNARYFVKDSLDEEYKAVTEAADIAVLVSKDDNNGFAFTADAIGKFVKLELSLDETYYAKISDTITAKTISCEFEVVSGYNVYEQMGLSVMDDMVSSWAPLKQITLEADSKPLVEYTDVTNVIIHGSITLDPQFFPEEYFWTEQTPGFADVRDVKLAENTVGLENKIVGSLRDYDVESDSADKNFYLSDNGEHVNVQKGLFNTSKCSISGNYNSIKIVTEDSGDMSPEAYKLKYGNRNLYSVYATGGTATATSVSNPISHWSLFKFFKRNGLGSDTKVGMSIKNLSCSGSMGHVEGDGRPAGLMMVNSYVDELTVDNVIGDRFYTNFVCDGAGDDSADSRIKSTTNFSNTKLINAYSNMIYTWRGTVNVENSLLRDAGGPLFLMVDGARQAALGAQGCIVTVDAASELSSYATGTESWYAQWNASSLLNGIKSMDQLLQGYFQKTMQYVKNDDGVAVPMTAATSGKVTYINIIAVMLTTPGEIMKGHTPEYLCAGEFKNLDKDGNAVNDFIMRTPLMDAVNQANTVLFQSGSNFAIMGGQTSLLNTSMADYKTDMAGIGAWMTASTNLVCTYMSAGLTGGVTDMPYFGVITGLNAFVK